MNAAPLLLPATRRAELDGLIAQLYGLAESEFAHLLSSFPPGRRTGQNRRAQRLARGRKRFENDDSLFHTLRQGDPVLKLIRENVAAAMSAEEIHEEVHRFFAKLTELVQREAP